MDYLSGIGNRVATTSIVRTGPLVEFGVYASRVQHWAGVGACCSCTEARSLMCPKCSRPVLRLVVSVAHTLICNL
eukprot:2593283-Amphidinium_carterae.1